MCYLLYSLRAVSSAVMLTSGKANADPKCSDLPCLTQVTMLIKILYSYYAIITLLFLCSREKHQLGGSWEHESLGQNLLFPRSKQDKLLLE